MSTAPCCAASLCSELHTTTPYTPLSTHRQVLIEVIWDMPRRHPSRQTMDSPAACATICAMPLQTNPITQPRVYATATPHCHMLPICYIALSDSPSQQIAPSRWGLGYPHSPTRKNYPLAHLTNNWHTHTELTSTVIMYDKLAQTNRISINVDIYARTIQSLPR